nr:hypothetical protein [Tanacetum cinerariifolium]
MEALRKKVDGTTERLIEDLESAYGRMYLNGHVDISDIVDIDLFIVVALNMMAVQLGYTGESEPLFYNYLRPLTSLDEGLYALACEENVRCLSTLVRSFKLIETQFDLRLDMEFDRWPQMYAGIQQHLQKIYNGKKAALTHEIVRCTVLTHEIVRCTVL